MILSQYLFYCEYSNKLFALTITDTDIIAEFINYDGEIEVWRATLLYPKLSDMIYIGVV